MKIILLENANQFEDLGEELYWKKNENSEYFVYAIFPTSRYGRLKYGNLVALIELYKDRLLQVDLSRAKIVDYSIPEEWSAFTIKTTQCMKPVMSFPEMENIDVFFFALEDMCIPKELEKYKEKYEKIA